MFNVFNLFQSKPSPDKIVNKWCSDIRAQQRVLDRQLRGILVEEKKVEQTIKQLAKKGDIKSCKTLAKEVVRSRKQRDRIATSKAQLNSISMELRRQLSMLKVAGTLQKSTHVMKAVNQLMSVPMLQRSLMEMSKEMMKAGVIDEMTEDMLDSIDADEDVEEEAEAEVDKVLAEVTEGLLGSIGPANAARLPENNARVSEAEENESDIDLEEMNSRLSALRTNNDGAGGSGDGSNKQAGDAAKTGGNGKGNATLASFTSLGVGGGGSSGGDGLVDTETMNLFGSFTNDAGATSGGGGGGVMDGLGELGNSLGNSNNNAGGSGFGQFSANDLSGFGVDLNSFDLGNGIGDGMSAAGMDLSSIQLMNLDDASLAIAGVGGHGGTVDGSGGSGGRLANSADDAAQMMARLLGGSQIPAATSGSSGDGSGIQSNLVATSATPSVLNASSNTTTTGAAGAIASATTVGGIGIGGGASELLLASSTDSGATTTSMHGPSAILSVVQEAQNQSANAATTASGSRGQKSRTSSQSSDDMGDIPLAQLTLMQSAQSAGAPVSGNGGGQFLPSAPSPGNPNLHHLHQAMGGIGTATLGVDMPAAGGGGGAGIPGVIPQTMLGAPGAGGLFDLTAQGNANIGPIAQGLHQQQQQQLQQQIPLHQPHQNTVLQQLGHPGGDLQSQLQGPPGIAGAGGMASTSTGPSLGASSNAAATPVVPEREAHRVTSTVHVAKHRDANTAPSQLLKIELSRPQATDTGAEETPLDRLEEIERQLCALLDTASKVIRIMTGPGGGEQLGFGMDVGGTKLKSMVKEFMQSVVRIHAAMQFEHKALVDRGIPMQATVGFQTDVAGFERDLVSWSDAARLLSSALSSAVDFSA
ncbi:Vacuolar protein-sorting-associated protein 24 [Coemansia sp. RSA 1200]|nr:Vacuolar protein-sorting-associated protein 24 [Coemansia sp. RSA 1200]